MTIYMPSEEDRDNIAKVCNCGNRGRYLLAHKAWCDSYGVPFTRPVRANAEEARAAHRLREMSA